MVAVLFLGRTAMKANELPSDLAQARRRFEAWRARRQGGERIPPALWRLAVRLVRGHGVSRTAMALRVDYYSLKKQVEASAQEALPDKPAFIELSAPAMIGKQCQFELDNDAGARLRLHLVGYEANEIETLARALWTAE
jgi:hypothetical protein